MPLYLDLEWNTKNRDAGVENRNVVLSHQGTSPGHRPDPMPHGTAERDPPTVISIDLSALDGSWRRIHPGTPAQVLACQLASLHRARCEHNHGSGSSQRQKRRNHSTDRARLRAHLPPADALRRARCSRAGNSADDGASPRVLAPDCEREKLPESSYAARPPAPCPRAARDSWR